MSFDYRSWTTSPGIGGRIEKPEDFVVKEILSNRYTKFSRTSSGMSKTQGKNTLCLLKKRGVTTRAAIEIVSKELGINRNDIGYAGLKDKFAVTEQYVTIRNRRIENIELGDLSLSFIGMTDKFMPKGDLEGNKFFITLHGCKAEKTGMKVKEILSKPMPNYFGLQRFGKDGNNHVIGRFLVKRDFDRALFLINEQYKRNYVKINQVPKEKLKFFVNSYQSFLFNEALNELIKKGKKAGKTAIFGFGTGINNAIVKKIAAREGITPESFRFSELGFSCSGSTRDAFIKLAGLTYSSEGDTVRLGFSLPKGSYATVLINELRGDQ